LLEVSHLLRIKRVTNKASDQFRPPFGCVRLMILQVAAALREIELQGPAGL